MTLRIGRTLPPAAAPIYLRDIVSGITSLFRGKKAITKFEEQLKEYYQVSHCFTVSSGKTALALILKALRDIHPGRDEVLIPAFSCYSLPSAIIRAGLKIRLCDLAPGTFDFDFEKLSAVISANKERLLCVVSVHLYGFPSNLEQIRKLVADDSIFIVEDAAQATGCRECDGKILGTIGDIGFISFGRGKALSTVEAGVIFTKRDDIAQHLEKRMKDIGDYAFFEIIRLILYAIALTFLSKPLLFWLPMALPFLRLGETTYDIYFKMRKMSPFQAGLAAMWKNKLNSFNESRMENVIEYLDELKVIGLRPVWAEHCSLPCLIRLPLWFEDKNTRESVVRMSERMGLGIARSYPDSVDKIPELSVNFLSSSFPVAKNNAEKLLTLPVHPYVTRKDRVRIVNLLAQIKKI